MGRENENDAKVMPSVCPHRVPEISGRTHDTAEFSKWQKGKQTT
jgi:hypothetical protein